MHAPCSLTSLVVVLAIAAVLSLSITVAVYSPLDWLVPAVAWRFLGGFTTQVRSQTVSIKYNISVSELRTILDPEPNIVVEDYVLDSDENEGGRANLTLYERAAAVAANTVSAKDAEPWLTWAHARFGDAGGRYSVLLDGAIMTCTGLGAVNELADKAAGGKPRAHNRRESRVLQQARKWLDFHKKLKKEIKMMEKGGGAWDAVMVGSSPLESFRGTMLTETFPGGDLIKKVYDMYFVETHRSNVSFSSHVLAISGMADISLPYGCTLESGEKVGVRAINMLQFLQARFPTSYLIYLAILPKGEEWPNRCSQATQLANAIVQSYIQSTRLRNEKAKQLTRLVFADFGGVFLRKSRGSGKEQQGAASRDAYQVKQELMPDTIHPNAAGMELLAMELEPLIAQAVARYNKEFGVGSPPVAPLEPPAHGKEPAQPNKDVLGQQKTENSSLASES